MKAHELLSDPSKWTQGQFARDKDGNPLPPTQHAHAACWCLSGAINKCYPRVNSLTRTKIFLRLRDEIIKRGEGPNDFAMRTEIVGSVPVWWNDCSWRKWQDVHNLLLKLDI